MFHSQVLRYVSWQNMVPIGTLCDFRTNIFRQCLLTQEVKHFFYLALPIVSMFLFYVSLFLDPSVRLVQSCDSSHTHLGKQHA
jgi:hypothetical protein